MLAHFGLVVLAVCVLVALGLIGTGALRVVRSGLQLKKRLAGYRELPLREEIELVQARVNAAQLRGSSIPALLGRARRAVADIEAARERVRETATAALTGVGLVTSFLTRW